MIVFPFPFFIIITEQIAIFLQSSSALIYSLENIAVTLKNCSESCQISLLSKCRILPGTIKRKNISKLLKIGLLGAGHVFLHVQTVDSEGITEEIISQYQMCFWNLNVEYREQTRSRHHESITARRPPENHITSH